MSRRIIPFAAPCHDDAEWICGLCERVICGECEPSPNEPHTCADCPDSGDAA
jgi:hypothetical protein